MLNWSETYTQMWLLWKSWISQSQQIPDVITCAVTIHPVVHTDVTVMEELNLSVTTNPRCDHLCCDDTPRRHALSAAEPSRRLCH